MAGDQVAILERDGYACKTCRVPNGKLIRRGVGKDRGMLMYVDETIEIPTLSGGVMRLQDLSMCGTYDRRTQIQNGRR